MNMSGYTKKSYLDQRNKMKNVTQLVFTVLFGFTMLIKTVDAGIINKGKKIYDKKIKGQCAYKTGGDFTAAFKQKEWENAFKAGKFEAKIKDVCTTMETYKEK